jgi:hypothetical protein
MGAAASIKPENFAEIKSAYEEKKKEEGITGIVVCSSIYVSCTSVSSVCVCVCVCSVCVYVCMRRRRRRRASQV